MIPVERDTLFSAATRMHPSQKAHVKWSPDAVVVLRALLLTEWQRLTDLIQEYTAKLTRMRANADDPMIPWVENSLKQYMHNRGYLQQLIDNIAGMRYVRSELQLAFKRADEYVPPPFRTTPEQPEKKK